MTRLHRVLATLALLVAATAVCATPALARKHDHDKLPPTSGGGATGDDPAENPADDPETDGSGLAASAAQDDPSGDNPALDDAEFDKRFEAEFAAGETCDASTLKRGSLVHEAMVDRSGPSPVVTAITLVRR